MSDENQGQQQQQQPQQVETKVIKQMVEKPDYPPKGSDSVYTIKKSEDPTDTRKLRGDA
jgi:hypothetical protein